MVPEGEDWRTVEMLSGEGAATKSGESSPEVSRGGNGKFEYVMARNRL